MPTHTSSSKHYRRFVLLTLTLVYTFNFIDRQILNVLAPFIQEDLNLSFTQMGLLGGLAFALFYTIVGIPVAWLADRFNRVNILSISLGTWSAFTALTGYATNFVQIGLARMGVGIGEAGGSPPSHSIISDLYAKEERASALGVYSLGIPFGLMVAFFVAAFAYNPAANDVDWRSIFIFLGVSGIILAIIVRLVLREPVRGAMESDGEGTIKQQNFINSFSSLISIPAWWAMCFGIAFASFVSYAISLFQTTFVLKLDPEMNRLTLFFILGVINGTTYAGGSFLGAKIADFFGKRSIRAYGLVPAAAVAIALPLGIAAFWVETGEAHLIISTFFLFFIGMYLGPSFAVAQTLAPINMRAMSTALFFFILNLIGLGAGPSLAGFLIDYFKTTHTELVAMSYAMSVTCLFFIPSIISYLFVAKILPRDWAAAEKRNAELLKEPAQKS